MTRRAWVSALGVLALAVFGLTLPSHAEKAAPKAKYKIHWYVGHQNPDYFEIAAKDFKREVEARTNGGIEVEIMTAVNKEGHDGATPEPEIAALVESGKAEMGHSFTDVVGTLHPQLYAFEAPYLFRSNQHMERVLEGPIGNELLEGFRKHNMVGLSFTYSGGPSWVATADRKLTRPEDLKGLKVGVYGDKAAAAWLESLGATPVPVYHDLPALHGLVKEGKADAAIITWQNFSRTALQQEFKYMSLPGSTFLVSVTYMNAKFFDSLPADYRKIVAEVSRSAGRIERAKTIELNANARRAMMGKGVRDVALSNDDRAAFAKALKPVYAAKLEGLVGKDLIERIRNTADGETDAVVGAK